MPNTIRTTNPFIVTGNPDTVNVSLSATTTPGTFTPYAPGELGMSWDVNDRTYEIVIVDSGCTSANAVGTVLANQLLFWKSKTSRIVTNDVKQAVGGSLGTNAPMNQVAGIARVAVGTPGAGGSLICMLTRGINIPVASDGNGAAGALMVADTTASVARVTNTAVGTAPSYLTVGVARGAAAGGNINVDVDIASLA